MAERLQPLILKEDGSAGRRNPTATSPQMVLDGLFCEEESFEEEDDIEEEGRKNADENVKKHSLFDGPSMVAQKEAVDWILRVKAHYRFFTWTAFLVVNYFDSFGSGLMFQRDLDEPSRLIVSVIVDLRIMSYLPSVLVTATMLHVIEDVKPYNPLEY
ncbi:cyclin-D3-1-like [Juglans microcarpa x Juglans regia]|uniref:cyclin-D3-1-like n=1 Tax=Juglans microcarpa x Juglans regia TaxID=2249226 RepID=UPI001B7F1B89|nr:cyclin-D3-1-like [Juglans microcarpa x Juglans regia]